MFHRSERRWLTTNQPKSDLTKKLDATLRFPPCLI
ncbi:hypothetical protein DN30_3548 [Vibrio cholerae]|nr:hypothetical protein DN30_3548 [Vibrio cholerae]